MQMLVEAETADHVAHSLLLQNAETVRLVGPSNENSSSSEEADSKSSPSSEAGWRAIPVSQLKIGDKLYVRQQDGARHTGISINESIVER